MNRKIDKLLDFLSSPELKELFPPQKESNILFDNTLLSEHPSITEVLCNSNSK